MFRKDEALPSPQNDQFDRLRDSDRCQARHKSDISGEEGVTVKENIEEPWRVEGKEEGTWAHGAQE